MENIDNQIYPDASLSSDGYEDPWLNEPWTEEELKVLAEAEKEEGLPWNIINYYDCRKTFYEGDNNPWKDVPLCEQDKQSFK